VPEIALTVENVLSINLAHEADSTFESGIGTATALANCVVFQTTAEHLDGTHSLGVMATASGTLTVRQGPFPVEPDILYSFTAAYFAASAGRTESVSVEWYDADGALISTSAGTTEVDFGSWSTVSPMDQATSPDDAVQAYLVHTIVAAVGPLSVPAEPSVTVHGATGSEQWNYAITAYNTYGQTTASPVRSVANGNATLTSSNYNALSWSADTDATGYDIYRSAAATCEDIALNFTNCAALPANFLTCADLITYGAALRYIGTTTGTSFNDTGFATTTAVLPTENTTGERHYVDEVGLFEGAAASWTDATTVLITILRSDDQYVLGASPLFPLLITGGPQTTAEVTDFWAPYGLSVTYRANVITAGVSGPSLPSTPVVMGQAPDTVALYNRMGWAKHEDASGALVSWLSGLGQIVQAVDNLTVTQVADGALAPPWSQVLDIDRCPTAVLPWLGQFVGVTVDTNSRDDEQRYAIEQEHGFSRGTPAAILAAANRYLLPGYSATLIERDTSAYNLAITIPAVGVVGDATCGLLAGGFSTCAAVLVAFATCGSLWSNTAAITEAVAGSIPAGLTYSVSFV
jgi:hypothetical protein